MTRDHTRIEELLAVEVLGGLDGDDLERLSLERAAHGDCVECATLERDFADTAGRLAFALEPEPVDASMADRILTRARADETGHPAGVGTLPATHVVVDDLEDRRRRPGRRWQSLVAAAAAFVLVVVAAWAFIGPNGEQEVIRVSTPQAFVSFTGTVEGELAMAYTPGEPGAVFWGSGLPAPGTDPDKTYEVWMFPAGTPVSLGCHTPDDGRLAFSIDADVTSSELMAVSIEDASCPSAPTTDAVLTAPLIA